MKHLLPPLCLLLALATGCVSKSAARAEAAASARAAYQAGKADAYKQMLQGSSVHVVGHVKNPDIPWMEGLTLSQVIVDAQCTDQGNPREIFITRKGERYMVDVKTMLDGQDWQVEAGDIVQINP